MQGLLPATASRTTIGSLLQRDAKIASNVDGQNAKGECLMR